jgi:hypothetical protein
MRLFSRPVPTRKCAVAAAMIALHMTLEVRGQALTEFHAVGGHVYALAIQRSRSCTLPPVLAGRITYGDG